MEKAEIEKEEEIWNTSFFRKEDSGGHVSHTCVVDYLSLLNLPKDSRCQAISGLKNVVDSHSDIEKDILTCLSVRNWRPHLVACIALIYKPQLGSASILWERIEKTSWVTPQLCITAYLIDPLFRENAVSVLAGSSHSKTVITLYMLLASFCGYIMSEEDRAQFTSARDKDFDNTTRIVKEWFESVNEVMKLNKNILWDILVVA